MGQYHIVVNVDKKEFVDTRPLAGSKLFECVANNGGAVMAYLLHDGPNDGVHAPEDDLRGRWVGDDVRLVGDYAESGLYKEALGYTVASKYNGDTTHLTGTKDPEIPGAMRENIPHGYSVDEEVAGWEGDLTLGVAEALCEFTGHGDGIKRQYKGEEMQKNW
jgi:hypothetical protein